MTPYSPTAATWLPFAANTSDLAVLDDALAEVVVVADAVFDGPAVVETRAGTLGAIVPPSMHDNPMWVIVLPDEFSGHVDALMALEPEVRNQTSVDLQMRRTTLEWRLSAHCITLYPEPLRAIHAACPNGTIVLAFVTKARTAVRTLRVDDELMCDLQGQGINAGCNYRPSRFHTSQELADARVRAVLMGNEPKFDEDGRTIVPLKAFSYVCEDSAF